MPWMNIKLFLCISFSKLFWVPLFYLFTYFLPHHMASRILVLWLWIEPVPSAVEGQSFNHWTIREVLRNHFLSITLPLSEFFSARSSSEYPETRFCMFSMAMTFSLWEVPKAKVEQPLTNDNIEKTHVLQEDWPGDLLLVPLMLG